MTIIEKRPALGRGLAYSTTVPEHVLNVRASNMSAFSDDPGHFARWLEERGVDVGHPETYFAPRHLYGDYLGQLLDHHLASGKLRVVDEECVELIQRPSFVELRLANGAGEVGDVCVLATGHDAGQCRGDSLLDPLRDFNCQPASANDPVLIVGTGLSMVDTCLALILRGHLGPIIAVSRRGLLPTTHSKTTPITLKETEIPVGRPLLELTRWVRGLVRSTMAHGGGWRDVVDGLRPHTQTIWRHLPIASRRQFFRHLKPWWDIHRHRMAPQIHDKLSAALSSGQLRLISGRIQNIQATPDGLTVQIQRRRRDGVEELKVTRVYDCKGIISDPAQSSNRLMRSLLESGTACVDNMRLGLDVTGDGALLDRDGGASEHIYAVGPLTRGAFLEIEAVPDIRVQSQRLAQKLAQSTAKAWQPEATALANSNVKSGNAIRARSRF